MKRTHSLLIAALVLAVVLLSLSSVLQGAEKHCLHDRFDAACLECIALVLSERISGAVLSAALPSIAFILLAEKANRVKGEGMPDGDDGTPVSLKVKLSN